MHSYSAKVAWSGSTGAGYGDYDRRHAGLTSAGFTLPLAADAAFGGDPACLNPEEMLVLAASSCQLLSFLAVAARARIDVVDYGDEAYGEMPDAGRKTALTTITLRPHITVTDDPERPISEERVLHLCEVAHRECYIANSLRTTILVQPVVTIGPVRGVGT